MSIPIPVSTTLALVLALPFWLAGPAQAFPVSFTFSGVLNHVDPQLGPPPAGIFQNNNPFSGSFTYESSTMALPQPNPFSVCCFYDALTDFRVTIQVAPSSLSQQTITFTTIKSPPIGLPTSVVVLNNGAPNGGDLFQVQAFQPLTGSHIEFPISFVLVTLIDNTASVFDNPSPLPTSLNLSQFNIGQLQLTFENSGVGQVPFLAVGPLSTLEPVPEPTTLLLFGSTVAGLGLARWRRRRQQ